MVRRLIALAGLITIIATGVPAYATPPPNAFSDRLEKLDPARRAAALRGAIVDSGKWCKGVSAVRKQGRYRNLILWAVRCDQGGDRAVYIGPDGSVQVRDCKEAGQLKLPACQLPPRRK